MYGYLASITSSRSGPFNKCKQHSTHSQAAVCHRVNTAVHGHHSNMQITGMILTANTTTDTLHLQKSDVSTRSDFFS